MLKLIIYDSSLENEKDDILLNSIREDVVVKSYSEIEIEKLNVSELEYIGLLFHNRGDLVIPFFVDEKTKYFSDGLKENLRYIREEKGSSFIVDILSCNFNDIGFINEVEDLEKELNIIIRYSLDEKGNKESGGNWVMESHDVNVMDIYFTESVKEWTGVLVSQTGSRIFSITKDNVMKASGLSGTPLDACGTNQSAQLFVKNVTNVTTTNFGSNIPLAFTTVSLASGVILSNKRVYLTGLATNNTLGGMTDKSVFTLLNNNNIQNIIHINGGGASYFLTINTDNELCVWGQNDRGQLGTGNTTNQTPVKISLAFNVKQAWGGDNYSVIVDFNGNVYCAGRNWSGVLGIGINNSGLIQNTFQPITYFQNNNIFISEAFAGLAFSIFLDNSGNVYSVGDNSRGALGIGDSNISSINLPTKINTLSNIVYINGTYGCVCAIDEDSKVYVWGINILGVLGLGNYSESTNNREYAPVLIPLSSFPSEIQSYDDIEFIYSARNNFIVLDISGNVYASGLNGSYEFGNGGNSEDYNTFQKITSRGECVIPYTDEYKERFIDLCFRTVNFKTGQNLLNYLNNLNGKIVKLNKKRFEKYVKRNYDAFTNKIELISGTFIENTYLDKINEVNLSETDIYYCLYNNNNNVIDLDDLSLNSDKIIYIPGEAEDEFKLKLNNVEYNLELTSDGIKYDNVNYVLNNIINLGNIRLKVVLIGSVGLKIDTQIKIDISGNKGDRVGFYNIQESDLNYDLVDLSFVLLDKIGNEELYDVIIDGSNIEIIDNADPVRNYSSQIIVNGFLISDPDLSDSIMIDLSFINIAPEINISNLLLDNFTNTKIIDLSGLVIDEDIENITYDVSILEGESVIDIDLSGSVLTLTRLIETIGEAKINIDLFDGDLSGSREVDIELLETENNKLEKILESLITDVLVRNNVKQEIIIDLINLEENNYIDFLEKTKIGIELYSSDLIITNDLKDELRILMRERLIELNKTDFVVGKNDLIEVLVESNIVNDLDIRVLVLDPDLSNNTIDIDDLDLSLNNVYFDISNNESFILSDGLTTKELTYIFDNPPYLTDGVDNYKLNSIIYVGTKRVVITGFGSVILSNPSSMVLTFNVEGNLSITLNLTNPDVEIDWGDTTTDIVDTSGNITHTYSSSGIYEVGILGTLDNIKISELNETKNKLISINRLGDLELISLEDSFKDCVNLVNVPSLLPETIINLGGCFSGCLRLNSSNLLNWDVSKITNMSSLFLGCISFNQDISIWNVENVEDMTDMFLSMVLPSVVYDNILNGWASQDVQNNVVFNGGDSRYTLTGLVGRNILINTYNWTIIDSGKRREINQSLVNDTFTSTGIPTYLINPDYKLILVEDIIITYDNIDKYLEIPEDVIFDGNNHSITLIGNMSNFKGLFWCNGGTIRNVEIKVLGNIIPNNNLSTGACGWLSRSNADVNLFVNNGGTCWGLIENSLTNGNILSYGGGISGSWSGTNNKTLTIRGCYTKGSIGIGGSFQAGGITGSFSGSGGNCIIESCLSVGEIGNNSGGICGSHGGSNEGECMIKNSYSIGNINDNGGGIVGSSSASNDGLCYVINCYSVGNIVGSNAGSIYGRYAGNGSPTGKIYLYNSYGNGVSIGSLLGSLYYDTTIDQSTSIIPILSLDDITYQINTTNQTSITGIIGGRLIEVSLWDEKWLEPNCGNNIYPRLSIFQDKPWYEYLYYNSLPKLGRELLQDINATSIRLIDGLDFDIEIFIPAGRTIYTKNNYLETEQDVQDWIDGVNDFTVNGPAVKYDPCNVNINFGDTLKIITKEDFIEFKGSIIPLDKIDSYIVLEELSFLNNNQYVVDVVFYGGSGGAEISFDASGVPCFTDTCDILTPSGYINVKDLKNGDLVYNSKGEVKRIIKTENKKVSVELDYPRLLKKDMFGPNKPLKDTYLSSKHAFYNKGKWYHPKCLDLEKRWISKEVIYYHIQLPDYDNDKLICNGMVMDSWDGKRYGEKRDHRWKCSGDGCISIKK